MVQKSSLAARCIISEMAAMHIITVLLRRYYVRSLPALNERMIMKEGMAERMSSQRQPRVGITSDARTISNIVPIAQLTWWGISQAWTSWYIINGHAVPQLSIIIIYHSTWSILLQ